MKRVFSIAALFLASCSETVPTPEQEQAVESLQQIPYGEVFVFIDPETKCQYLIYSGLREGGIVARMKGSYTNNPVYYC